MATTPDETTEAGNKQSAAAGKTAGDKPKARRSIPGDFSYTPTYGKLRSAFENMLRAERPEVFNKDFLASYLGVSGGSAAPIPPILRRMGFISADGKPTELYAKFQNDSQRPAAALEGLRKGFPELFKRNTYAHSLSEDEIKNILVEITGLKKNDTIVSQIYGTFDALRHFVPTSFTGGAADNPVASDSSPDNNSPNGATALPQGSFGLSYHINIVLPETKDVAVFNAIFQSLKQNLLS